VIKNLAPEAFSDEGLPRKKKLVEAIGQSKATQEDKDAKEKAKKSNNKQQKIRIYLLYFKIVLYFQEWTECLFPSRVLC
jgi:predicted CopG family antitoxin